jgi:hypothetical protein
VTIVPVAAIGRVPLPLAAPTYGGVTSLDPFWWVAQVALVAVVAMLLPVAAELLRSRSRLHQMAEHASNPLVALVLGLIVLGGWRLSQQVVSVVAVAVMIALELGKSLPAEHRYRRLADGLTAPLVASAVVVIVLSGLKLAEIIGFIG